MAKTKSAFVCNDCGADYRKWQGQCSATVLTISTNTPRLARFSNQNQVQLLEQGPMIAEEASYQSVSVHTFYLEVFLKAAIQ